MWSVCASPRGLAREVYCILGGGGSELGMGWRPSYTADIQHQVMESIWEEYVTNRFRCLIFVSWRQLIYRRTDSTGIINPSLKTVFHTNCLEISIWNSWPRKENLHHKNRPMGPTDVQQQVAVSKAVETAHVSRFPTHDRPPQKSFSLLSLICIYKLSFSKLCGCISTR